MGVPVGDISAQAVHSEPFAQLSSLRKQDCPQFGLFKLLEYFGQLNLSFILLKEDMINGPKIELIVACLD